MLDFPADDQVKWRYLMPKGRRSFTPGQANRIRVLLSQIRNSSRDDQKRLRQQLRDMRFYISDWARPLTGFTANDFDTLVRRGDIRIEPELGRGDGRARQRITARSAHTVMLDRPIDAAWRGPNGG